MKLLRYGDKGKEKPGVEFEGIRFDCSKFFKDWDNEFFINDGIEKLRKVMNTETLNNIKETHRWGAPIARPGMVICVGLNYSDHVKESGFEIPTEPVIFMKPTNTVAGPFDPVIIPPGAEAVDWEIELGIVLNKNVYRLNSEEEAEEAIAGYTIIHDISERHYQLERGGQWVKGKGSPGFCPVGPYLVTKDEIENVLDLTMTLDIGEERMQDGSTANMIFKPAFIVHYISQFIALEAGDLISTGTPHGVGTGMDPKRFMKAGETTTLEIEGLGQQQQYFRAAPKT